MISFEIIPPEMLQHPNVVPVEWHIRHGQLRGGGVAQASNNVVLTFHQELCKICVVLLICICLVNIQSMSFPIGSFKVDFCMFLVSFSRVGLPKMLVPHWFFGMELTPSFHQYELSSSELIVGVNKNRVMSVFSDWLRPKILSSDLLLRNKSTVASKSWPFLKDTVLSCDWLDKIPSMQFVGPVRFR